MAPDSRPAESAPAGPTADSRPADSGPADSPSAGPTTRTGPAGVVAEFFLGVALLGRGFAFWTRRPGLMALGLLPALIVGAILVTAVTLLGVFLDPVTSVLTFFADGWDPVWRDLLRIFAAVALIVALLALAARVFTAVTLLVGAPFYDRIQRAADAACGDVPADRSPGVWRSIGDTIVLIVISLVASIVVAIVGLIPVVGSVLAAVIGFVVTARALTWELTLAPFGTRGLIGREGREALRGRRARAFGFGVAVQVCYLIPLGAVITMPAAVAGAAILVRQTLGEPDREARRADVRGGDSA